MERLKCAAEALTANREDDKSENLGAEIDDILEDKYVSTVFSFVTMTDADMCSWVHLNSMFSFVLDISSSQPVLLQLRTDLLV